MRQVAAVALCVATLATPRDASATAVTVCANAKGIVVSADSKLTVSAGGNARASVNKIIAVGDRTVVTLTGVAIATELNYEFPRWLQRTTARLDRNPPPVLVATSLQRAAKMTFRGHGELLRRPGMATYFVVAGVDDDGFAIWEVHLVPRAREVGVELTRRFGPDAAEGRLLGYGFPSNLPFDDYRGPLWTAVRQQTPSWLLQLGSAQRTNLYQHASFCAIPIAVAAQRDEDIALPINQALVTKDQGVVRRVWSPPSAELRDMP